MAIVHQRGWDPRAFDESDWYASIAPYVHRFREYPRFPSPDELTELYAQRVRELGLPALRFAPSPAKKPKRRGRPIVLGELYEGRIVEQAEVPTRLDDWHDFFNALSFVTFPRAKAALHARQYRALSARLTPGAKRLPGARTREQDALALFDEGGIAMAVERARFAELPTDHDALEPVLLTLCAEGRARAVPFGHALFEHIVEGLPCPLGTVQLVPLSGCRLAQPALLDALDVALAELLADPRHFTVPSPARGLSLLELGARAR